MCEEIKLAFISPTILFYYVLLIGLKADIIGLTGIKLMKPIYERK